MIDETTETEETPEEREEMARARAENRRRRDVLLRLMEHLWPLEQTGFIESYEAEEAVRGGIEVLTRMVEEWRERQVLRAAREMLRR
jgi:hypothetical protein